MEAPPINGQKGRRSRSRQSPFLLISGPTASGKSSFAIQAAKKLNSEIVSVDSVHVYRGLNIGSAKATPEQLAEVPHHLIDVREPDESYNVAMYVNEAETAMNAVWERGKSCILCGGTTLYIKSLVHGLAELPSGSPELRQRLEAMSSEDLYATLEQVDPVSASRLHHHDRLRVIRAVETFKLGGVPASELQAQHSYRSILAGGIFIILFWERDTLYQRIETRVEEMIRDGIVEETAQLIDKYGKDIVPLGTVGYSQAVLYLSGELSQEELAPMIAQYTRRLAKRQMTFWRNEPVKRKWSVRPTSEENGKEIGAEASKHGGNSVRKGIKVFQYTKQELLNKIEQRMVQTLDGIELWYVDGGRLVE